MFNPHSLERNHSNSELSKSISVSPRDLLTPLYFLKNPYRILNVQNPKGTLSKRFSQENNQLVSQQVAREEQSPLLTPAKPKQNYSNTQTNSVNKRKKRTSFLELPPSTKPRLSAKKEVSTSNESSSVVQDSTAKEKVVDFALSKNHSKNSASKEIKDSGSTSRNRQNSKLANLIVGHSPARSFEESPFATNGKRTGDVEQSLSKFGRTRTEKNFININIIKTANQNVLGNAIRRKSCHCSDCGGMSTFEKKHMNIAIPPKRVLKNKQEKSRSTSRRSSKLVKSPSCITESVKKKPFKLQNSASQGFKGSFESLPIPFMSFGTAYATLQRSSLNTAGMKRDIVKDLDPVRRSVRSPENKNVLDDKPVSGRQLKSFRTQMVNDEVVVSPVAKAMELAKGDITITSSVMSSMSLSPAVMSARNSRLEPDKEYKMLPFLKLSLVEQNTRDSPMRGKGVDSGIVGTTPKRLGSPKNLDNPKEKSGPFKWEDKQIKNVYNMSFSGLQLNKKITNNSMKLSPRTGKYPMIQGESQYMLPSPSSFSREESGKKKKKGETDQSHDPYHMGSVNTKSFAMKNNSTSKDKSKIDKSKDMSEEKIPIESPKPLQIKLGKLVTAPLLSDRVPKTIDFSAIVGKSTTSIEKTPRGTVEKPKKSRRKLKGQNFNALGLDKIMKAYESFEVLPSLRLKE